VSGFVETHAGSKLLELPVVLLVDALIKVTPQSQSFRKVAEPKSDVTCISECLSHRGKDVPG
jgi:hypothetical protein